MVWRLPPGLKLCENPPPEDEVKNALSAQYKSTYRNDFLGIPQGTNTKYTKIVMLKCHLCSKPENWSIVWQNICVLFNILCIISVISSSFHLVYHAASVLSLVLYFLSSTGILMKRKALDPVKHISEVPQSIQTEMRYNYRKPVQRPEFWGNISHREAPKGIGKL